MTSPLFSAHRMGRVLFLMLLLAVSVVGCTSNKSTLIDQNCTPSTPAACSPGSFTETTLDTNFHGVGTKQNHIVVVPMPYSTDAQDFSVTFARVDGEEIALVTSTRVSPQSAGTSSTDRLWAYRAKDGEFVPIEGLDTTVPVGAAYYSRADGLLYYSAHSNNPDPDDYDLFSARLGYHGGVLYFGDVRPIAALNEANKFDSQPTLDASGTTLLFVSDRAGGNGGTDIWVSKRASKSAEWSTPAPLEGSVNTPCDELSPSFGSDGNLYFSSNGHSTVGGYDLFVAKVSNGTFGEPQNLGKPINTEYDELFPTKRTDSNFYWSSNRPSGPMLRNIFTISHTGIGSPAFQATLTPERPTLAHIDSLPKGPVELFVDVTGGRDSTPAAGTELFVRRDSVELYRDKSPSSGKFKIKLNRGVYDVGAETKESFFDVKHVDLRSLPDSTMHLALNLPDTLVLRINFPFDDHLHPYEFVIDDNGNPSTMTWIEALDLTARSTLRSVKSLKRLIVIGHTDSLGSDAYNDRLGMERAQFVAAELVKRGVPARIISVSSRGRMQPVAIRPGETDEEFRLRSRRVEFVKVF